MKYKKFTIKGFRCFSNEETLVFAQPISNKPGSGITYIVGANNSGKTTLIEGLWMNEDQKIKTSEKKLHIEPEFCLYDTENSIKQKVCLTRPISYTLKATPKIDNKYLFEIVTSRRHWDSTASSNSTSTEIIASTARGNNPRTQQGVQTASILRDIEKDDEKYSAFTKLVQDIIPEFTQWAVAYEDHEYIEYTSKQGVKHKTDFLGDGVISIIRILAHLFEKRASGLVIDEPELSLHPLAQKKLVRLIAEYARDRQIVISTHSPYFVSWEYLKNGAILNRVVKTDDTYSKIYTIREYSEYSNLVNGGNWQQPYLMDSVSKEIFFQENILFVEGQEDVGLLQEYFSNEHINFFGYGVRGYDNFEFALKLANDLGIKRACVLIDSPSNLNEAHNETTVKEDLEKKYGEKYKILQWNKNDIRDKPEKHYPTKEGYFTDKGKIKSTEKLDDFDEKICIIKKYFEQATISDALT